VRRSDKRRKHLVKHMHRSSLSLVNSLPSGIYDYKVNGHYIDDLIKHVSDLITRTNCGNVALSPKEHIVLDPNIPIIDVTAKAMLAVAEVLILDAYDSTLEQLTISIGSKLTDKVIDAHREEAYKHMLLCYSIISESIVSHSRNYAKGLQPHTTFNHYHSK